MKKIILACALLFPFQSQARQVVLPYYSSINNISYDKGYYAGVRDQKYVTTRAIVATGVIVLGTIIIYKAFSGKDVPQGNYGRLTYRF